LFNKSIPDNIITTPFSKGNYNPELSSRDNPADKEHPVGNGIASPASVGGITMIYLFDNQ